MAATKTLCKFLGGLMLRTLAAVLAGVLLLSAVCLLPSGPIDGHVEASADTFAREGMYPSLFSWCTSQLDNYTDAIILLTSANSSSDDALTQALSCNRGSFGEDSTPYNDLVTHYTEGKAFRTNEPYYRYWHGYQLFTRPLLLLTGYQGLRLLNAATQLLLLAALIWLLVKKDMKECILPYLLGVAFLNPVALVLSLQFSSCYYAMTLGALAVLLLKEQLARYDARIFLYIGIATAYFDLLTYPIATVGVPAVLYFCARGISSIRDTFCRGVKICFSWGFGYGLMWAGKWIVGSLLLGGDVLASATSAIAQRTSGTMDESAGLIGNLIFSVATNIKFFLTTPVTLLLGIWVVAMLVLICIAIRKAGLRLPQLIQAFFPFLVLALLPVVWYMAAAQHSSIHYWFTNKGLVVSALAGMCALTQYRKALNTAQ